MKIRLYYPAQAVLCFCIVCVSVTGCGTEVPATGTPATTGSAVRGRVYGGQQPVVGSVIQLYAVGASGNQSAATPLIASPVVVSDSSGSFTITGDYTCPAGATSTPVYLTATGGNPGLGGTVSNPAVVEVAVAGPCNQLLATDFFTISETTTAAAAWALAPFASSALNIGASSTNTTGIPNAMRVAQQLVDPRTGASPGSAPTTIVVESAKLYSLADVLASCVNTTGLTSACASLFADVTPPGGVAPTDTFSAALDVVRNPAHNVAAIYTSHVTATPPYPPLAQAPNDWTMTLTYETIAAPLTNFSMTAMDANGTLWGWYIDDMGHNSAILSYSRQLALLTNTPLAPASDGNTYNLFSGPQIDPAGNAWITIGDIFDSHSNLLPPYAGSVLELDSLGNIKTSLPGYSGGGIASPGNLAIDRDGSVWIANSNNYLGNGVFVTGPGDISVIDKLGNLVSPSSGFASAQAFNPIGIAFDSLNNAWITSTVQYTGASYPYMTGIQVPVPTIQNPNPPYANFLLGISALNTYAIGVDTNDNIWFTQQPSGSANYNQLGEIGDRTNNGITPTTGGGLVNGLEMAIDPSNHIFVESPGVQIFAGGGNTCDALVVAEFAAGSTGGTALSPSTGFGSDSKLCGGGGPILIDTSGILWVAQTAYVGSPVQVGNTTWIELPGLTLMLGLGSPTKTPLLGPPQAP